MLAVPTAAIYLCPHQVFLCSFKAWSIVHQVVSGFAMSAHVFGDRENKSPTAITLLLRF